MGLSSYPVICLPLYYIDLLLICRVVGASTIIKFETKTICLNTVSVTGPTTLIIWKLISLMILMSCAELKLLPQISELVRSKCAQLYQISQAKRFIVVSINSIF